MRHGDAIEKCGVPVERLVNALAAGLFCPFFPCTETDLRSKRAWTLLRAHLTNATLTAVGTSAVAAVAASLPEAGSTPNTATFPLC